MSKIFSSWPQKNMIWKQSQPLLPLRQQVIVPGCQLLDLTRENMEITRSHTFLSNIYQYVLVHKSLPQYFSFSIVTFFQKNQSQKCRKYFYSELIWDWTIRARDERRFPPSPRCNRESFSLAKLELWRNHAQTQVQHHTSHVASVVMTQLLNYTASPL